MQIDDTLGFLLGAWTLTRTITDHRTGVSGRFEGTATLLGSEDDPRSARYHETGRLRYGSHDGQAKRTLHYLHQDTGCVLVSFSDGRPFFELDLRRGSWLAQHPCNADHYALEFKTRSDTDIDEQWRVQGPRKDYTANTQWRRRDAEFERLAPENPALTTLQSHPLAGSPVVQAP